MQKRKFQDLELPFFGMGCMRLPLIPGGTSSDIDAAQLDAMVDYAMANGVNYFDTAYMYHNGVSETAIGKSLSRFARDSFFLADKYPGHQIADIQRPKEIFEEQLERCKVDYFDFYLLHNVYENSIDVYKDPKWGIVDYFVEQKKKGKIRHLGFSTHGSLAIMEDFISLYRDHLEFCQIELNYLDWTLQNASAKVDLLNRWNLPIWVMEPLRGGKLARPGKTCLELFQKVPSLKNPIYAAFRYLQDIPGVTLVLSGTSSLDQLKQNTAIMEKCCPLSQEEKAALYRIAEAMKNSVPCTACRYCTDQCPKGLDIPLLLSIYNELQVDRTYSSAMRLDFLPQEKKSDACISCGKCSRTCPQKIDIPTALKKLTDQLQEIPSWTQICKEGEENAKRNQK